MGESLATAIEIPILLSASWFVCAWVVRTFAVPAVTRVRLALGGLAFALVIAAETALGVFGFGRTLAEQAAAYREFGAFLGLLAQIAFAAFPVLQGGRSHFAGKDSPDHTQEEWK